jgi:hypothetical protein
LPNRTGRIQRTIRRSLIIVDRPTPELRRAVFPGAWRNAFIRMPFARECTIQRGIINDTFETAITWERFESFRDRVKATTERAIVEATGRAGQVTCRCTHVYPDGQRHNSPAAHFMIQKERRSVDYFAGLDVSVKGSSICIVDHRCP